MADRTSDGKADLHNCAVFRQPEEQISIFISDLVAPCLRDERSTMEYPFFSLEKKKRMKPIVYDRNGVKIEVRGVTDLGICSIWDADFLIWCASQIVEAQKRGEEVSSRLLFSPFKFMVQTYRADPDSKSFGGKNYKDFLMMLDRLQGTQNKTNLKAGGESIDAAWSWLESYKIHRDEKSGRVKIAEVVLASWFFKRIVLDLSILAISPEYFKLSGGMERWLYKIARKHCGSNDVWSFKVKTLFDKYPSPDRPFRKFKADLRAVVLSDGLPEYHTKWDERLGEEYVVFLPREGSRERRKLPRSLRDVIREEDIVEV